VVGGATGAAVPAPPGFGRSTVAGGTVVGAGGGAVVAGGAVVGAVVGGAVVVVSVVVVVVDLRAVWLWPFASSSPPLHAPSTPLVVIASTTAAATHRAGRLTIRLSPAAPSHAPPSGAHCAAAG
jgi:hypothetical protein